MDIAQFIKDDALVMIPILYFLGMLLKNTPQVPSWTIPYVILLGGVPLTIFLLGFEAKSFVQGFLVSGAAVYMNNLIKQAQHAVHDVQKEEKK